MPAEAIFTEEGRILAAYRTGRSGSGYFVKCIVSGVPDSVPPQQIEKLLDQYGFEMKEKDEFGKPRSAYTIAPLADTPKKVQAQQKKAEHIPYRKLKNGRAQLHFRTTVRLAEAIEEHVQTLGVSRNEWLERLAIQELERAKKEK